MMWTCFVVTAWLLANIASACTEIELEAIQSPVASKILLIHSIDDVLNGSMSRSVLLKILSFADEDRELPLAFNKRALRTANTYIELREQQQMCIQTDEELLEDFETLVFLTPEGVEASGIVYGCYIISGMNVMIFFYDEQRWNVGKPRYHESLRRMSENFKSEICCCNSTVEKFIHSCEVNQEARRLFRENLFFTVIFVLVSCVVCSTFVFRYYRK